MSNSIETVNISPVDKIIIQAMLKNDTEQNKEKFWIPELDMNGGMAYEKPSTSKEIHETQDNAVTNDNDIWNYICKTTLLNDFKNDFAEMSHNNKLLCMAEIFNALYFCTYLEN